MKRFLALPLLASVGCATISSGASRTETKVLSVRRDDRPSGVVGRVRQLDTALEVVTVERCEQLEVKTLENLTHTQQVNRSVPLDVTIGVIGGTLLGVGVGILGDVPSVYPNDRSSRTFNPNGPEAAIGLGVGMSSLGLAIGSIALVDLARTLKVKETKSKTEQVQVLDAAPCRPLRPIAAEILVLDDQSRTLHRQVSGADGRATLDLVDILARTVAWSPQPQAVKVYSSGVLLGEPDLANVWPVARDRADEWAWEASSHELCAKDRTPDACFGVSEYLRARPAGLHAADARVLEKLGAPPAPVAVDPKELERRSKALAAAGKACRSQCSTSCGADKGCLELCLLECPPPPLEAPKALELPKGPGRAPLQVPGGVLPAPPKKGAGGK